MRWTERRGFKREIIDYQPGEEAGLKSLTFTVEMKPVPTDNLLFRLEYRGDFSDLNGFVDSTGAPKKNQQSIIFGALYNFSTK